MLDVMIAEDNLPISVHLSNTSSISQSVRCVGILNDGAKVYQKIRELNPDVLILDLKMPGENGLQILEKVEADKQIRTKIFIYSGESEYMELAREYECIDRFISKLTPAEQVAKELEKLEIEQSNKYLEEKIIDILFKIGFSYSLKGTRLMWEAIQYSIEESEDSIENIYQKIAKLHKENVYTVKSDINTAIKNMWRFTDREKTRKILRLGQSDKPSAKNILSMIAYYVRNR